MQRGLLTDIAGTIPEEVDGHLIRPLFPKHLLQHPKATLLSAKDTAKQRAA